MMKHVKIIMAVAAILTIVILMHSCSHRPVQTEQSYSQSNQESSRLITGGFGYKFGDILDKSRIVGRSYTNNPLAEGYIVQPIINNKTIDYFSVEVCKRTKEIYNIAGFKIYNSRDLALRRLRAARPHIEKQYGKLNKLPEKNNFYAEYVAHGSCQVRLIATPGNFDSPKWGFIIMYKSDEHERKCGL